MIIDLFVHDSYGVSVLDCQPRSGVQLPSKAKIYSEISAPPMPTSQVEQV